MAKFGTIRQKYTIPARPEEIYDAFVDAKKHSEFTGSPATGTPEPDSKFTAWDGYITGKFVSLQKGKKFVQEWKTTEWPKGYPHSVLEFAFKKKAKGTEVSMVHSKVPLEQLESYRQGWIDSYWEPLKAYFTKRQG
jgi:activator of HSP90 ATPase